MPEAGGPEAGGRLWWLASFPKSGNTWFRIVLANLLSSSPEPIGINDVRLGQIASSRDWLDPVLGIDTADLSHDEAEALRPLAYDWLSRTQTEPGYNKIHDRLIHTADGLPLVGSASTAGAVYLVRNPLDVASSLANHNGSGVDAAIAVLCDPDNTLSRATHQQTAQLRQRLGTWSEHVLSWADAPEFPVLVLRYEDLQADPTTHFAAAARFLRVAHDPEGLARALDFSRFERLSAQETERGFRERSAKGGRFFRAGRAGGWRTELSAAQIARIVASHAPVMRRFGYLDADGEPT